MNGTPGRAEWNAEVTRWRGSFLQSWEWGELQESLGNRICRVLTPEAAALAIERPLPLGQSYWYIPRGPVISSEVDHTQALKPVIDSLQSKDSKKIFIRLEPEILISAEVINELSFRKTIPIQPKQTRVLDLSKSENELLKEMEHDTRYAIRTASKRGVMVSVAERPVEKQKSFSAFWRLFEETNTRHHLRIYSRHYYELVSALAGDCHSAVFLASAGETVVASALVVFFGGTAVYLYAASAAGYGRLNAPTLIIWEAIREAKRLGYQTFDFWGVGEGRWASVTAFKKTFGGRVIEYPGTWDYPLNSTLYGLYAIIRKWRR